MSEQIDLDELERLEKAATPGPWRSSYRGDGSGSVYEATDALGDAALLDDAELPLPMIRGEMRYEDGVLSVAIRNAAPELLRRARRLEKIEAAAKDWGEAHDADCGRGEYCKCGTRKLSDALEAE